MSAFRRVSLVNSLKKVSSPRMAWLWLLVGFVLLLFTFWQNVIPLAAWLAPVCLLRFNRTCTRRRLIWPLLFLAYTAAIFISLRGAGQGDTLIVNVIGGVPFVVKGFMYTLPYAADRWFSPRLGKWGRTLVFPLAFVTVDWLTSLLALVMTIGSPAYSQYGDLALMQIISVTGMWGLTFLIMWFAATLNGLWEQHFAWRAERPRLALFAGVLAAVLLFGGVRLWLVNPDRAAVEAATITFDPAVSQAASSPIDWVSFNQSSDAQRTAARPSFAATVNSMLGRTETALRGGARIVVWQEAAALVLEEDRQSVLDQVSALARQYNAYIQVGLFIATRTPEREYIHNQAILIDNTGQVAWEYEKAHPVFPGEAFVVVAGAGKLPVMNTSYGRMSTAICNDLHFQALLLQAGQQNVDILLAPYGDLYPYAHEDFVVSVYRAIENGMSVVRSAGNGTSAVIDPQGRVLDSRDFFTNPGGILLANVPAHGIQTLYSRIGDLFAYLCGVGLVVLAGLAIKSRRSKEQG